jgi:steroid delta-isomerase-like uncharacterized protein
MASTTALYRRKTMMTTHTTITIGRALLDALNAHDLSPWQAVLAEDVVCSYPGFRGENGKEAAKAYNAPFLIAFSDLHFDILRTVAEGDTVVYVWNATGTHDGPLALPSGSVPPTGKRGVVPGTLIATIKDGMIIREETYWNQVELLEQLGLMG